MYRKQEESKQMSIAGRSWSNLRENDYSRKVPTDPTTYFWDFRVCKTCELDDVFKTLSQPIINRWGLKKKHQAQEDFAGKRESKMSKGLNLHINVQADYHSL